ncbi:hypothetical protein V6Z92_001544 [Aspergillus fumigatus]
MRFITVLQTIALLAASMTVKAWNQLDKENAAVLIIDYHVGLAQLDCDFNTNDFRNNMLAHAALGNLFDLSVVMTTSSDAGPNGLMIKEVVDLNPNVTIVHRQGEVNAWDNAEFRAAIQATGKKQLIVSGIVTEVCTAFLALSLIDEGYEVSPTPRLVVPLTTNWRPMPTVAWRRLASPSWAHLASSPT